MTRTAVVIIGHGSREASANAEFEALCADYRQRRDDLAVSHGYVELAQASVSDALVSAASSANRVVALPLFLFTAGHVKNDLPLALANARVRFPRTSFVATRALGVHPSLCALALRRAAIADASRTAVIVVGRGSSDPDANGDFCKVVRLLGEGRGFAFTLPAFIGITGPLFEEAAELVARVRPERLVVIPYFLFGGRLISKLDEQVRAFATRYPWIQSTLTPHLGSAPELFEVMDERLREALAGSAPLPCDTCQYRTPLPALAHEVGGLRALLWSLRHTFTHSQAAPHVHAHRPLRKHVLVCGNVDCADRGSIALLRSLQRMVKDAGRELDIRITRTSCMGRCGEGPTVAVYPDGIWYRGVAEADANEIVREHLLGDRLVARLVDNIIQ